MPKRSRAAKSWPSRASQMAKANSPRSECSARAPRSSKRCSAISLSDRVRKTWPSRSSSVADPLEVVELAVGDDAQPAVFVGDRLIAGLEIDDAQPRVAEAGAAIERGPDVLGVRTSMTQPPRRARDRLSVNSTVSRNRRNYPAHRQSSFVACHWL